VLADEMKDTPCEIVHPPGRLYETVPNRSGDIRARWPTRRMLCLLGDLATTVAIDEYGRSVSIRTGGAMGVVDAVVRPTLTTVQPGSITKSDTAGTTPTADDKAPSFVSRESFASFTGASAVISAIGVPLSKLAANYDISGGWIPYALAFLWAALNIWTALDKNREAHGPEKAITIMIGLANGAMLGTVGLGLDQAIPTPAAS
jgi:hypothetical protein